MRRAAVLLMGLLAMAGCKKGLRPIPGTTTRVGVPETERGRELKLRIFTTEADCSFLPKADRSMCLPYVDRGNGDVRLAFEFRDESDVFPLPLTEEHIKVGHLGQTIPLNRDGMKYKIVPHNPSRSPQLFILLIDGSSSMAKGGRMKKVRNALLMPAVKDAFFPGEVNTRVAILQFTDKGPVPLGGKLQLLEDRKQYSRFVKQHLRVLQGYTHLYDAITYATGALLQREEIKDQLVLFEMTPTIVALTDGFNNSSPRDTCSSNVPRLNTLLKHLENVRAASDGTDPRQRPSVYTVGLGRPLRPGYQMPEERKNSVTVQDLCGKRYADRRIDGDLERKGIDNASLAWIAKIGGGSSYVRQDRDGLGAAFQGAAAERYDWFEVWYHLPSFYLRRAFKTRLVLDSIWSAGASVEIHPSAWLDAPPGKRRADGWSERRPYRHTAVVLMPFLGLMLSMSFLGAAMFNTRRAIFGRSRRPSPRRSVQPVAPPPPPPAPPTNDPV
jgi:hypothetical protein